MNVRLQRISPNAKIPVRGSKRSAYYDLYAAESYYLNAGEVKPITTGWSVETPKGWFLDVRPRSGVAAKGITVNNSPGTVDEDFRGELKVILINHSSSAYLVAMGDRIAQCALMPMVECGFAEVKELTKTERGKSGYGSTGK
jgi:dUTP pyrophosphatase